MKKEQVLDLMSSISPDLIEEAGTDRPAKRRLPKLVRAGLIAACLCLALLGTAFAANPEAVAELVRRFVPVYTKTVTSPDGAQGVRFHGDPTRYPLDSFSPDLLADCEGREDYDLTELSFDSAEEALAFIGRDIPLALPELGGDWGSQYYVYPSTSGGVPRTVNVGNHSGIFLLRAVIYTERYHNENGAAPLTTMFGDPDATVELSAPYQMANGCQAQITLLTSSLSLPDGGDGDTATACHASFICDGILYQVTTCGISLWSTQEETLAGLYEALDSFP